MMKWKEHFEAYTKDDLMDRAKSLGMTRLSRLKKDELIDRMMEHLTTPEIMESRFSVFSDGQIAVFERATQDGYVASTQEHDDACRLAEFDYLLFGGAPLSFDKIDELYLRANNGDRSPLEQWLVKRRQFSVPAAVAQAYQQINTPEFHAQRKRISWLAQCMELCNQLYGVAPLAVLHQVYCQKFPIALEQLPALIHKIPEDMTHTVFMEGGSLDQCLLMDEIYAEDEERFCQLTDAQGARKFYIPFLAEQRDYLENLYMSKNPYYQSLLQFLTAHGLSQEDADGVVCDVWHSYCETEDATEILDEIFHYAKDLTDADRIQLNQLLQDCYNNTRKLVYRGYTQAEVQLREQREHPVAGMPLATGVGKAQPQKKVKIGRNDPCPCGSGKKYKKCCGR